METTKKMMEMNECDWADSLQKWAIIWSGMKFMISWRDVNWVLVRDFFICLPCAARMSVSSVIIRRRQCT